MPAIDGGDNFLGRIRHVVRGNYGKARGLQRLSAQLLVCAFHAHHQGNTELHFFGRRDHAFSDRVAAHDSAENVDQNSLDRGILQHQLECFSHLLRRRTAADVQKIRGLRAE